MSEANWDNSNLERTYSICQGSSLIFKIKDQSYLKRSHIHYVGIRLFTSAYIAERPHHIFNHTAVGLRVQFELLELAAIKRPNIYDDGIILTGYYAASFPTGRTSASIQWHLVVQNITPNRKRSWLDSNRVPIFSSVVNFLFVIRVLFE
jgi:hypothetical protein